jgi:hypothetical protein
LYQLLDYHPAGGGQSRTFSERFGIIGKVWRTEKSLSFNHVDRQVNPGDDQSADAPMDKKLENIMSNWGMSRREAEHAMSRPSSICMLLEHDGEKVGILYIDSDIPEAFPDTSETELEELREKANTELAPILDEIIDELSSLRLGLRT